MATNQLGSDYLLYIDTTTALTVDGLAVVIPGTFKAVCDLTDNGNDGTTDQIDTSGKCKGLWKDSEPGEKGWTFSASGNAVTPDAGTLGYNELNTLWRDGTTFWVAQFNSALNSIRYGKAYISSWSEANPKNAPKTFTVTFQGKSDLYDQSATT